VSVSSSVLLQTVVEKSRRRGKPRERKRRKDRTTSRTTTSRTSNSRRRRGRKNDSKQEKRRHTEKEKESRSEESSEGHEHIQVDDELDDSNVDMREQRGSSTVGKDCPESPPPSQLVHMTSMRKVISPTSPSPSVGTPITEASSSLEVSATGRRTLMELPLDSESFLPGPINDSINLCLEGLSSAAFPTPRMDTKTPPPTPVTLEDEEDDDEEEEVEQDQEDEGEEEEEEEEVIDDEEMEDDRRDEKRTEVDGSDEEQAEDHRLDAKETEDDTPDNDELDEDINEEEHPHGEETLELKRELESPVVGAPPDQAMTMDENVIEFRRRCRARAESVLSVLASYKTPTAPLPETKRITATVRAPTPVRAPSPQISTKSSPDGVKQKKGRRRLRRRRSLPDRLSDDEGPGTRQRRTYRSLYQGPSSPSSTSNKSSKRSSSHRRHHRRRRKGQKEGGGSTSSRRSKDQSNSGSRKVKFTEPDETNVTLEEMDSQSLPDLSTRDKEAGRSRYYED